jgi:glycogen debranching enzyme
MTQAQRIDEAVEEIGYIAAQKNTIEHLHRNLKSGDAFAVFDAFGDILSTDGSGSQGFYYKDTRYVSGCVLLLNGERPLLLNSSIRNNNVLLRVDLTNPDIIIDGKILVPKDALHIKRSVYVWAGALYQRIRVTNFSDQPVAAKLSVICNSDFRDLFEVRGMQTLPRRVEPPKTINSTTRSWHYAGQDGIERCLLVQCWPEPSKGSTSRFDYDYTLKPGEERSIFLRLSCHDEGLDKIRYDESPAQLFFRGLRRRIQSLQHSVNQATTVSTNNEIFNEILCRAMADLYMLNTRTEHGYYPYAGIPWFSTVFGRDGIITALQTLWFDPKIAHGVLCYLAANQATDYDAHADAEPGKILHETREGELARLSLVPFRRYYGSIDSTVLFVLLAAEYVHRTGDHETLDKIWPNILAALEWMDRDGDSDKDGFIEYKRKTEDGLVNQGWKDSGDCIFHADGQLAKGSIALCEVQAYAYAAKLGAARLASIKDQPALAKKLRQEAAALKKRFNEVFWSDELGMYALALDGEKKRCMVRSSNAGQTLFTGIVPLERAKIMADKFLQQDFFSGWGVRTIPIGEKRYNPMSYHNGSVWPHDNALIAMGLARYGLMTHVSKLFDGMFGAATHFEQRRIPELFCGFRRKPGQSPVNYPVACIPQAWATVVPFTFLNAVLGITINAEMEEIQFKNPSLPGFLQNVTIRGLSVGETRTDVVIQRHNEDVSLNTLNKKGKGKVTVAM